ncbi:unnamed protein product [Adineta ricciae]|uniref:RING-type domain-containing protein n=1 Tax=Adineta ricciae TaxID=249248 RepID=A0A816AN81_ADIRI|nr:unnamed protein product [Adineta ricciae]CAF1599739.1 unnamed protein product [Adineta ricciae]
MMTRKDSTVNDPLSQSLNYNTYSTFTHDYHHRHNPWEKPTYATFAYQPTPFTIGTLSSTGGLMNKSSDSYSSSNLNHTTSSLCRRHTESALPTSTSIYASSTSNHLLWNPFHYPQHTPANYHPPGLFLGWNNGPSLMRTHSASFRDYPQSTLFPPYNLSGSSISQPTTTTKSTERQPSIRPINTLFNYDYSLFSNGIPPSHLPLSSLPPTTAPSKSKRSIPTVKRRPRITPQLRYEILKLKTNNPTMFIWEIQQALVQNGVCTSQTLPNTAAIQRILNESPTSSTSIKDAYESPSILPFSTTLDNLPEAKTSSSVTICLSSSPSDTESTSECSICLDTYRSGQEVSILSCSHEYHSSCIKEWMIKNRSCPMCRKDIHNQPQFVTLLI